MIGFESDIAPNRENGRSLLDEWSGEASPKKWTKEYGNYFLIIDFAFPQVTDVSRSTSNICSI